MMFISHAGRCIPGLLAFVLCAQAQDDLIHSSEAEGVFRRGLALYTAAEIPESIKEFDRIISDFPLNQRTTAAWVMKGKGFLRLNNYLEADRTLKTFVDRFPFSTYVPDAEFTRGLVFLAIGRHEEALELFRQARKHRGSTAIAPRLGHEILSALDQSIEKYLTVADLEKLLQQTDDHYERMYFWVQIAEKNLEGGNVTAVLRALDTLKVRYPQHPFRERTEALLARVEQRSSVKIGLLLPILRNAEPSALKEVGNEALEGIELALEDYRSDPSTRVKVSLEVRDSEREIPVAMRGAQELADDKDIIGIIGPLFSNVVSAVAPIANARKVPMITPTANANGIAAAGPFVFQANPDLENRGRAMARFAMNVRKFKKFAILAPKDGNGKLMAESFQQEVQKMGGRILAMEWYQRGSSDLKSPLYGIRKIGLQEEAEPFFSFAGRVNQGDVAKLIQSGVSRKMLDTLIERGRVVNALLLLGPQARARIDSLGLHVTYQVQKIDSLEIPVTAFDAMYVPINSPVEIGVISSQLVYFNFQTQILGSGEWNNIAELSANKRYCNNVIFESESYADENEPAYVQFYNAFLARFKKRPTKNTLYGYDTARLMFHLIHNGATTQIGLQQALSEVRNSEGLHAKTGLVGRRVNSWVHILQYSGDVVTRLTEINVDEQMSRDETNEIGRR